MTNGTTPVQIDVQPGATLGDYVNQLVAYLGQAGHQMSADMTAKIWVRRASDHALPADVAVKVSELALAAYSHRL